MQDNITRIVGSMPAGSPRRELERILSAMADRFSAQATSTAGLVVGTAPTTTAKIGAAAFAGVVNGVPVAIAAGTHMPALTGTTHTAAYFNVYCFFIDSASTVTAAQGTEGATLAAVKWPAFPKNKALVGYIVVTYASPFVPGTTALSTATTVYVSPVGAFDPTLLTG